MNLKRNPQAREHLTGFCSPGQNGEYFVQIHCMRQTRPGPEKRATHPSSTTWLFFVWLQWTIKGSYQRTNRVIGDQRCTHQCQRLASRLTLQLPKRGPGKGPTNNFAEGQRASPEREGNGAEVGEV